ncbi:MAG: PQQ-binding-like beta-propeller repeat protein [Candidatus Nealsonbacteria bacterium]|nr:PQQ-binding-like beta-propeller repeat protein [Candidatus Nealsonbacteria bacterium]
MHRNGHRFASSAVFHLGLLALLIAVAVSSEPAWAEPGEATVQMFGIGGGLYVQVGTADVTAAAELAKTGRFLVHLLDADAEAVAATRESLHGRGLYGLASVDRLVQPTKLPYCENLVNLLVIDQRDGHGLAAGEIARVLCPGGVVAVGGGTFSVADLKEAGLTDVRTVESDERRVIARKPRPAEMDEWSHPRHGADGNAVSRDVLVGPPRRVRWVTGPSQEISNMVTTAGRNFYAGLLARDGFNGLQLWQRGLNPSPARGGFNFRYAPGSVRPVAVGDRLLVVTDGKLVALDAATGRPSLEYTRAGTPTDVLHVDGTLVTFDATSVRGLALNGGRLLWKHEAPQPRHFAAGDGAVYFIQGVTSRGQQCMAVRLDLATGKVRWQKDDFPWAAEVRRCVYNDGQLAYEVSTLNDDKPNNRIHVVSADDAKTLFSHTFIPGTAHKKQARALFVDDELWVLDDRKCTALDRRTGEVKKTYGAGWGHCFPPVATRRYLFAGEMDMTDLQSGQVDANRITKGACGRDAGFVPANGLIYAFPKHCICWPMLRGYAALATARPGGDAIPEDLDDLNCVLETGVEPPPVEPAQDDAAWPCYRHDAWRSGSTTATVPADLKVRWTAELGTRPQGPIADDWRHNPFVLGPVTPPVIAGGKVFVAWGDAHQIVALDAASGKTCWTFTANGRIDSAPTLHGGMCLFGTKSGWVYGLRADDGRLVWRLRAAPVDERIVAYGQLESPWPVPGSVLVVDGVAFFAAGRQSLADGGILVFAVDPSCGKVQWVKQLDSVPQRHFYGRLGLEFDNFDLLHREGTSVAMSRWLFDRGTGKMHVEAASGFALLKTGGGGAIGGSGAIVPRGCWSYAPRNQSEQVKDRPYLRPLTVFRGDTLVGCKEDKRTIYRRDFDIAGGEKFNSLWSVHGEVRKTPDKWRSERLARGAKWSAPVFDAADSQQRIAALVLAGETIFTAGSQGGLVALSSADGKVLARHDLPTATWDGLAAAGGRLFVTTQTGEVICLGGE